MIYPVILDPETFLERGPFYDFESFVWNEKAQDLDDFQLITPVLPEGFDKEGYISVPNSSKVCMVTSISYSISSDGKTMYDVKGENVLGIYKHRPAIPEVRSTDYFSKMYPDGWEWGDKFSDLYNISPAVIFNAVSEGVDLSILRYPELSFLQLPLFHDTFSYGLKDFEFPMRMLNYYSIGRNSTVWDVYRDLMKLGSFKIDIKRPGFYSEDFKAFGLDYGEEKYWITYNLEELYYDSRVTLRYGDYDAATQVIDKKDASNVVINSVDDWVYLTKSNLGGRPKGLNARVRYFESDVKDLTEKELEMHIKDKIITETLEQSLQSSSVDLSIQKDPYNLQPGALVRIDLPWHEEPTLMTVTEVVQTQDSNGYRKYPRLVPFTHPFVSTESENPNHKSLAHPSYFEFKDNLSKQTSWT